MHLRPATRKWQQTLRAAPVVLVIFWTDVRKKEWAGFRVPGVAASAAGEELC